MGETKVKSGESYINSKVLGIALIEPYTVSFSSQIEGKFFFHQ